MTCLAWFKLGKHDERHSITSPPHSSSRHGKAGSWRSHPPRSHRLSSGGHTLCSSLGQETRVHGRCTNHGASSSPGGIAAEARPPGQGMGNWRCGRWESCEKRCLGDTAWPGIAQPYGEGGYHGHHGIRVSGALGHFVGRYLTSCALVPPIPRSRAGDDSSSRVTSSAAQSTVHAIRQLAGAAVALQAMSEE